MTFFTYFVVYLITSITNVSAFYEFNDNKIISNNHLKFPIKYSSIYNRHENKREYEKIETTKTRKILSVNNDTSYKIIIAMFAINILMFIINAILFIVNY